MLALECVWQHDFELFMNKLCYPTDQISRDYVGGMEQWAVGADWTSFFAVFRKTFQENFLRHHLVTAHVYVVQLAHITCMAEHKVDLLRSYNTYFKVCIPAFEIAVAGVVWTLKFTKISQGICVSQFWYCFGTFIDVIITFIHQLCVAPRLQGEDPKVLV